MEQQQQTRQCPLQQLRPGMRLAGPAKNTKGAVVLQEGTVLDGRTIALVQRLAVEAVEIVRDAAVAAADAGSLPVTPEEAWLFVGAYSQLPNPLQGLLRQRYAFLLGELTKVWSTMRLRGPVDWQLVRRAADEIADLSLLTAEVLPLVHFQECQEPYLYQHSLQVAFLTGMILRARGGGSEGEIRDAVGAALLHDVGKLQLPGRILEKTGPLTAEEERLVRTHPLLAYRYLKEHSAEAFLSLPLLLGVLQHHERPDGQGYPMGVGSMKTHRCAKVVALADTYAAMARRHGEREPLSPFRVARELHVRVHTGEFDLDAGRALLREVHFFLLGQKVELSNGKRGWVVQWDEECGENLLVSAPRGESFRLNDRCGLEVRRVLPM